MANYIVTLTVSAGKGSSATFTDVNGSGLTSGNPLDLQIGDTVQFRRNGLGTGNFTGLAIFTDNSNIAISHGGADVTRTVASGGTTADSITGSNQAGNATDTFFFERQGAAASYSLATVSNMNEGVSQTVTVNTANVANGTTLYFTISPSGQDFNSTSGSFTINSNTGSFTITTLADQSTEGSETKTISIRTGSASGTVQATQSFTVFDTSTTPAATFSLATVSNMNEGATQSVAVTTTNFGSGTLYWTIDGSGDFTAHSGSVAISGNSGSISISSVADQTTEGSETKYLRLRTGSTSGTNVATRSFTLLDTSTAAGGGGSGGSGTGGSTTGTANYGVAVYGVNGSSVVFGTNLRTQNAVFSTTLSAVSGTTYGPFSVADANNTSKIQIFSDYNPPNTGTTDNTVSGSQMIITKSSTGFTFRHTAGGTKTFLLTAIKIA